MTLDEIDALNKFSQYFNENDISVVAKVGNGFVFYSFGALQPVYVDKNGVHGLNGNITEDRKIMDKAAQAAFLIE